MLNLQACSCGQQILDDGSELRTNRRQAEQPSNRVRGGHHRRGTRLADQGNVVLLTNADDDAGPGVELPGGERGEDGGIVARQTNDDLPGFGHLGPPQQITTCRIPQKGGQPVEVGFIHRDVTAVNDDDPVVRFPVTTKSVDCAAALRAVADHDNVIAHFLPPLQVTDGAAALIGQHSDGGTDQQHQEADTHRGDEDRIQEPGVRGKRGDVAVARGGHCDR